MKNFLVCLSGGMDSATCLGWAVQQVKNMGGGKVSTVTFNYGSKHARHEIACAEALALDHYKLDRAIVHIETVGQHLKSNLLHGAGDIPEGHYEDANMAKTVVPGRNSIFATILLGMAQSHGFDTVVMGVHTGDHAIYPDCRPYWVESMNRVYHAASEGTVQLVTPVAMLNKLGILKMGMSFDKPVPFQHTRTCYKDQLIACGRCGSCQERLEAFRGLGFDDPIPYESREAMPKS